MERRVLVAISLSFLVLFLFQRFVMPPPAPAPQSPGATAGQTPGRQALGGTAGSTSTPPSPGAIAGEAGPIARNPLTPAAAPAVTTTPDPATSPGAEIVLGEAAEREIVVDTTTVRAVFSNRGARLLRWTLKAYRGEGGAPLELVPAGAGADAVKPFSLAVDDAAVTSRINSALYRVTLDGIGASSTIDATTQARSIAFEMSAADGLAVTKTFSFEPDGYLISFGPVVQLGQVRLNPTIHWGPGLGDEIAVAPPSSFFSPSYNTPAQAIVHMDGSVDRIASTDAASQESAFLYAGVNDQYFVSVVINEQAPVPFRIDYAPVLVPQASDPATMGKYVSYAIRYQTPQDESRIFFGPKDFESLRAIDTELVRVINFGIFSWLAVPLLGALKWVHGFIGNWGWSIVVLTILINIALFPLRHKSVVSMRKMQEIQPLMKAIQDRYAKYKVTDPERQKMNTEVMALYKAKGVNPASGCVPMLLTMPFLFAFYSMLSQAIEIRDASFIGWITDLAAPDPLFISPLIMGASMFWQQRMMPTTADPTQAKIMMFMPIMFTFMSLSFPSGLVVYWTVSNVFTIGQQYFTNYLIGSPAKPAPPAAKPAKPAK